MMKSKFLSNTVIGLLFATAASSAWAGGVSDGGGGTTNPDPAGPHWIVTAAFDYAAPMILTWLNAEEAHFGRLSEDEKASSPFRKLFGAEKSIYDVVKQTALELRMSEPCYDANGVPKDGSIYASKPGVICISPFLMAPKLNENNYHAETAALILHEITHLMGTDEAEAQEIQRKAMRSFIKTDHIDLGLKIAVLADSPAGSDISQMISVMDYWLAWPQEVSRSDVARFSERLLDLRDEKLQYGPPFLGPQFLRPHKMELITPQFLRLDTIQAYLCANDASEDPYVRQDCAEELEKAFQSDSVVTARQYESRLYGATSRGSEWDEVTIQRPQGPSDIAAILTQIRDFLLDIRQDVLELDDFRFQGELKK